MRCCGSCWRGGRSNGLLRLLKGTHPAPEGLNAELAAGQQRRTERRLPLGQTEQIGRDAHLAIAGVAGTDPDHRDRELRSEAGGQLRRDVLEHQREATGRLQVEGGAAQALLTDRIVGLTAVTEPMHRLGREAEVAHHRDAGAHETIHHGDRFRFGALELDGGGGTVLEHAAGGGDGIVETALITEEGQIGDDQRLPGRRPPQAPADGAGVQDHFLQRDRQGGGVAQHHHRQGVADEDHIRTGLLHQGRRERIPGGEHGDRPPLLLVAEKIRWSQGPITTLPWAYC